MHSPDFLSKVKKGKLKMFYLDAHFYNPNLPKRKRFVVKDELKSLKKTKCIIIIHDFDNGLGHINYDGIRLDMKLIKKYLNKVNKFFFYTNRLESCDIVTTQINDILSSGLIPDEDTLENLEYAWRTPRLTYRGILYCLPKKLNKKEIKMLGLREWN